MSAFAVGRSAIACLLALGVLAAAGCTKESPAPEQGGGKEAAANAASPDEAAPRAPAQTAGAVDRSHKGEALAAAALSGVDGKPVSLAAYRGKPLLVNLWATWCAPCVAEMPTLDAAAGRLAGKAAVVVINQGEDAGKVQPFLARTKLAHARPLLDAKMAISMGLGANLPTTILYDAQGREVWRVTGGRDWASPESLALVQAG